MGIFNIDVKLEQFASSLKMIQSRLDRTNEKLDRIIELLEKPCDMEACADAYASAILAASCLPTEEEEAGCNCKGCKDK